MNKDEEINRKILEEKLKDSNLVFISSQYPMTITGYKLIEQIGAGASNANKVWKAQTMEGPHSKAFVAIKQIDLMSVGDKANVQKECMSMSLMASSPHVRKVLQISLLALLTLEGSLRDVLRWKFQNGFSDEKVIARILLDTLQGLKALHSSGMIHRDIKCGNLLYDKDATIKLADFGVSTILARHDERRTTMVGTWHWMAPEVIDPAQSGGYGFPADIWSLGITSIELAYGVPPYFNESPNQVVLLILNEELSPSLKDPKIDNHAKKKFSKDFHDFIECCLERAPKKRPTAEKLIKHALFKPCRKETDRSQLRDALLKDIPPIGERFKHSQASKAGDVKEKMANAKDLLLQVQKVRGESVRKLPVQQPSNPARESRPTQKPTTPLSKAQYYSDDDEVIDFS